jgi:hypothetical protein
VQNVTVCSPATAHFHAVAQRIDLEDFESRVAIECQFLTNIKRR